MRAVRTQHGSKCCMRAAQPHAAFFRFLKKLKGGLKSLIQPQFRSLEPTGLICAGVGPARGTMRDLRESFPRAPRRERPLFNYN